MLIHSDGQFRATHLILNYTPIFKSYQASKCVIKAKEPRLHQISVAAPGFLTTNPIPEGITKVALPFQRTAEEEATPSQPTIKEGEEVVEVSDLEEDFEVFNQPLSLEVSTSDLGRPFPAQSSHNQKVANISDDKGIQRKQRSTLQELLES